MGRIPTLIILPAALAAVAPAGAQDYLSMTEARQAVFPEADGFVDVTVTLTDAQRATIQKLGGTRQRWKSQVVWRAEHEGTPVGWFIVDEVVGKHEFITYAVGIAPGGVVKGIEILVYRETYGYQVRETDWRKRFVGKSVKDPFQLDADIPNITGATLSCRNVTSGVKRILALYEIVFAHAR
jgi:Na+-translocating ferredoxin:NAD+ oxidoreductase RnfG subunit